MNKQYCVTVKLYAWAESPKEAAKGVKSDLEYLIDIDSTICGFINPEEQDAVEDKEP